MSYKKIKLFCVTDKPLKNLENTNLVLDGVGKNNFGVTDMRISSLSTTTHNNKG